MYHFRLFIIVLTKKDRPSGTRIERSILYLDEYTYNRGPRNNVTMKPEKKPNQRKI